MELSDAAREAIQRDQYRYERMARRKGWLKPSEGLGYFNRYRCLRTGDVQRSRIYGTMVDAYGDRLADCGGFVCEGTFGLVLREDAQ